MARYQDAYKNNQTPTGLELRIAQLYEIVNDLSNPQYSDWLKLTLIGGSTYRITDGVKDFRLEPTSLLFIDILTNTVVPYTFSNYKLDGSQITITPAPPAPNNLRIKGRLL